MSQSSKRPTGTGGSGSGSGGSKPGGSANRNSANPQPQRKPTPGVVRQPVNSRGQQQQSSSFRSRIDETLPPFTARRYGVIWLAVMVPLVFVILVLTQCNGQSTTSTGSTASSTPTTAVPQAGAGGATGNCQAPASAPAGKYMLIDTAKGCIAAQLHTETDAGVSKTIANFEQKANSGYFNGLNFHRVEDWVIQGGDPKGDGTGGGTMPSEYNKLPFKTGALGVARGGDAAINNDSQFFIVKSDADYLDGQYTNFGQVVSGMDVVTKIAIGDKINTITVTDKK